MKTGTLLGWGAFQPGNQPSSFLRRIELEISQDVLCKEEFPKLFGEQNFCTIYTRTENYGACVGDSGGPFVVGSSDRRKVFGILSKGPAYCSSNRTEPVAGLFARLTNKDIADWIKKTSKKLND
ncbi:chymotrypsin-1-like [Chrysoperla carnea]|uniref:chymotrypsin-1-like n=1 Tax=Chrysoperla carnea TaxID=189513 RepID=UPI001D069753|nr:chymotrypsin-1-like [Chrysoperla carnea]